jgi:hypothetical protein
MNAEARPRITTLARRVALLCVATLTACASLTTPTSIDIEAARIQQAIAQRFPFETRWLGLFDVSAAAPRLRLLPETNRIATDIEVNAGGRLLPSKVHGALSLEGGLRIDSADGNLRLAGVRVERFALSGLPDALWADTVKLGPLLAEQLLEGMVVYTLNAEQKARLRERGVQPGEVRVTSRGLSIALEPIR